jgi:hypothetical protein
MIIVIHSFGFSEWHFSTLFDASLLELKATFFTWLFFGPDIATPLHEKKFAARIDRK